MTAPYLVSGTYKRSYICGCLKTMTIAKNGPHTHRHSAAATAAAATAAAAASEIGRSRRGNKSKEAQPSRVAQLTFEELRDDHPSEHVGVFHHERLSGLSPARQITRLVGVAGADHLESFAQKDGLLLVLRDAPAGLRAHGVIAACGHAVRVGRSPRAGRVFCLALTHCWHLACNIWLSLIHI